MRRKVVAVVAILAIGLCSTGCSGLSQREVDRSIQGKVNAAVGGLRNISRFVDRHLFNYTWDDPYAFTDYAGR